MGRRDYGLDTETVDAIAADIGDVVAMGVEVCLVIGGGNIFRGVSAAASGHGARPGRLHRHAGDCDERAGDAERAGEAGVPTRVQSAIPMASVCEPYIRRRAERHMEKGRVVIFAAGTGNPFFTTDTAAALRANEMGCQALFKGTQVDGVYSADPRKVPGRGTLRRADLSSTCWRRTFRSWTPRRSAWRGKIICRSWCSTSMPPGAFAQVMRGEGRFTRIVEQQ